MVMVHEGTEQQHFMDGYLKQNLDLAKKEIKKDWDMIFVIDGYEGSGKSVLAQQMAYYCDTTLDIDRIVFNPDDFKEQILNADKYQAVIFDEAYGGLSSKSAMGKVNKSIVQKLTIIREKNLFIFIVLPTFFDLDKYVALWRSRALIHVYTKQFQRGRFMFYNMDLKKQLYVNGKKYYNYSKPRPNFFGNFPKGYRVDEMAYRTKKTKTSIMIEDSDGKDKAQSIKREVRIEVAQNLKKEFPTMSNRAMAKVLGVSHVSISNYLT